MSQAERTVELKVKDEGDVVSGAPGFLVWARGPVFLLKVINMAEELPAAGRPTPLSLTSGALASGNFFLYRISLSLSRFSTALVW